MNIYGWKKKIEKTKDNIKQVHDSKRLNNDKKGEIKKKLEERIQHFRFNINQLRKQRGLNKK